MDSLPGDWRADVLRRRESAASRTLPSAHAVESVLARMRREFPLSRGKTPPSALIIAFVASEFDVTPLAILGRSRMAGFVLPRHVAFYLMRQMTSLSSLQISRCFHRDEHTGPLRAGWKIAAMVAAEPEFAARIAALRARIEEAFAPFRAVPGEDERREE